MNIIDNIMYDPEILKELTDNIEEEYLCPEIMENIISLSLADYAEIAEQEEHNITETRADFKDIKKLFESYGIHYYSGISFNECDCDKCKVITELWERIDRYNNFIYIDDDYTNMTLQRFIKDGFQECDECTVFYPRIHMNERDGDYICDDCAFYTECFLCNERKHYDHYTQREDVCNECLEEILG